MLEVLHLGTTSKPLETTLASQQNDDMLAWILMQVGNVLKMPNSQAAVLFQDVSLLMIYM